MQIYTLLLLYSLFRIISLLSYFTHLGSILLLIVFSLVTVCYVLLYSLFTCNLKPFSHRDVMYS